MPARLGCDPDAIEGLSKSFRLAADRLGAVSDRLAGNSGPRVWSGPDHDAFEQEGLAGITRAIGACRDMCAHAAEGLQKNAQQQRNASAPGAASAASIAASAATPSAAATTYSASASAITPSADAMAWSPSRSLSWSQRRTGSGTPKNQGFKPQARLGPDPTSSTTVRRNSRRDLAALGLAAQTTTQLGSWVEQVDGTMGEVQTRHDHEGMFGRIGDWLDGANPNRRSDAEVVADLKAQRAALDDMIANDRQVLTLRAGDPEGDFRVVEVIGDLATASSVIVEVPGMSTGPAQFDDLGHHDALALRAELERRHLDGSVAVVSWANYQIPQTLPEATRAGAAKDGGAVLSRFVQTLNDAGFDPHEITVVGHSYGSALLGYAMEDGLGADTAVAVGSPGMGGADSRAALGSADTQLWVGEAEWDVVADTGALGADPSSAEFGANTLPTNGSVGHSEYFKRDSQSLRSIVDVATK